MKPEGSFPCS